MANEPTDLEIDQAKLRNVFDRLKDIQSVEFNTEAGQEIQRGIQEAWKIVKPYMIELSHRLE